MLRPWTVIALIICAPLFGAEPSREKVTRAVICAQRDSGIEAGLDSELLRLLNDAGKDQCQLATQDGGGEIWVRTLQNGELAVGLFNKGKRPVSLNVIFSKLNLQGTPKVRNVWKKEDWGKVQGGFAQRVDPGGAELFLLAPAR